LWGLAFILLEDCRDEIPLLVFGPFALIAAEKSANFLTHAGGREYENFMRGKVDSKFGAGEFMPLEKKELPSIEFGRAILIRD